MSVTVGHIPSPSIPGFGFVLEFCHFIYFICVEEETKNQY
jgi:hypothetical protein